MDRKRPKRMRNEEWVNPADGEAEITRLKDGRTGLAYKAEQAVDMETGAILQSQRTVARWATPTRSARRWRRPA